MSAPQPIAHLYITLRRGLAGVRESHRAVVASLGLRRREQTVRRRNDASIRGAVLKVRHLLTVETDEQRAARLAAEATAAAPRPPLEFSHPPPPRQAQGHATPNPTEPLCALDARAMAAAACVASTPLYTRARAGGRAGAKLRTSPRHAGRAPLRVCAIGGGGGNEPKKTLKREEEPEQYWQSKLEKSGKSPLQDPAAIIGIVAIFFPFVILGIAIATGVVDLEAGRGGGMR